MAEFRNKKKLGTSTSRKNAPQSSEMPFIAANEKMDEATRKLIRSHVMQGRKKINIAKRNTEKHTAALAPTHIFDAHHATVRYPLTVPGRLGGDLPFLPLACSAEVSAVHLILKSMFPVCKIYQSH